MPRRGAHASNAHSQVHVALLSNEAERMALEVSAPILPEFERMDLGADLDEPEKLSAATWVNG